MFTVTSVYVISCLMNSSAQIFLKLGNSQNISERLHCWTAFCENVFQIRSELSKSNYWWLVVWKVAQISQDRIKMLLIIKYYVRRLNSLKKFLYKSKTTAIGKSFVKNRKKTENIFLHSSNKISGNFDIKNLWWSKTDFSKEMKKYSKRYSTNFSSSHPEAGA